MNVRWETLIAGLLIAASIGWANRYQILDPVVDSEELGSVRVGRFDTWTGRLGYCEALVIRAYQNSVPLKSLTFCTEDQRVTWSEHRKTEKEMMELRKDQELDNE